MRQIPSILWSSAGNPIISRPKKVNFDSSFTLTPSGTTLSISQPLINRSTVHSTTYFYTVAGVRYFPMMEYGTVINGSGSIDPDYYRIYLQAGVFSRLSADVHVLSGSGVSTFTLMIDGQPTALTATTLSGSGDRWSREADEVNEITVTDGQYACMKVETDGSSLDLINVTINFAPLD